MGRTRCRCWLLFEKAVSLDIQFFEGLGGRAGHEQRPGVRVRGPALETVPGVSRDGLAVAPGFGANGQQQMNVSGVASVQGAFELYPGFFKTIGVQQGDSVILMGLWIRPGPGQSA